MIAIFSNIYKKLRRRIRQNTFGKKTYKYLNICIVLAIIFLGIMNIKHNCYIYTIPLTQIICLYSLDIFFICVMAGTAFGVILLQYVQEPEIAWLLSLPITYKEIAKVKIDIVILGIIKFGLLVFIILIPWGKLSMEDVIHWCNSIICITEVLLTGIMLGGILLLSISLLIHSISILYIISFGISGFLLYTIFNIVPVHGVFFDDKELVFVNILFLLSIFFMKGIIYKIYAKNIQKMVGLEKNNNKTVSEKQRGHFAEKTNGLFIATLKKEWRYYKRELQYIVQFIIILIILTVLIIQKAQEESAYVLATYVLLYTMPFNLCGLVSVYSFGAEYSLLQTVYIVRKNIILYYLSKTILPFLVCFIPITFIYYLYTIVSREPFLIVVWIQLEILLFYYAAFGTATSCVFMKVDKNNLVLTRGVKISGTILYYILGIGFPILIAFYQEGMFNLLPMGFQIYSFIQLLYSLIIIIMAPICLKGKISG